jgi:predicted nucleic acid-binding protein
MIIYLDTSSMIKLYVEEEDSGKIASLVQSSKVTATSLIAYVEARAAFARRFRERAFTSSEYGHLVSSFDEDWGYYMIMSVTAELVRLAGGLAEKHGLRGFDAIHLSSAMGLRQEISAPVIFSCCDQKLQKASQLEGMGMPE